ncbi:MAG: hypothetical protein AVDCRST_MAG74-1179 [uncultured Pyrinomonadaceae bacterium]|uniref:DUF305 domain-containing protein n=1 Tax=uncultured Pyrinomonadaceae bacterium TaxID=2283094 RepID=A0A6J4NPD2_9BACT|nr:MAG: hypothetical protein AVDCRST_MAG74-1179 [uncultured Pyrinomonadaceae bacterium]
MKTLILLSFLSVGAFAFVGCQTTTNTTTTTNTNTRANTAVAASNANSMGNMSGMNPNSMMTSANHDVSGMNHSGMKSSPNAASQPYDLQFLDTMTHHHQGALDMAKTAVGKTNNQELKAFAQKIIADQTREIAQMKDWREKWYSGKPMAMNMEMPGMGDGMKMMMSGDGMKKFEAATGKEFDLLFLDMMTPHHQGATTMAKEALTKAEHPEIKTLANQIIKAQDAEIKQMADWKAKWSK